MIRPLTLAALVVLSITPLHLRADSPQAPTLAEQYLLAAANQERAALGLRPLHRDPQLVQAASAHARAMAAHRSISHQFPGEPELADRASTAGVRFSVVSENVGEAPSPLQLHDLWMHSEHHRENLLDPAVDVAGISVVARNGQLYAVEDFAKTGQSVSLGDQETAIASLVGRRGLSILAAEDNVSAARRTCSMNTGYAGANKPTFVMRFTSDSLYQAPRRAHPAHRHRPVPQRRRWRLRPIRQRPLRLVQPRCPAVPLIVPAPKEHAGQ